jgi:hypothetical protein
MMMVWTGVILTVCLAPIAIWLYDRALSAAAQRRDSGDAGKPRPPQSPEPNLRPITTREILGR